MQIATLRTVAADDIADCDLPLTPARQSWLERLDRDASPLLAHLAANPARRLGLYFESLWHFFLRENPETELIASNLPVHDAGRTLGEFDVIYFCHRRGAHFHLELAVKYYLGVREPLPGMTAAPAWVGPDARDRLDIKLPHMLERQSALARHPAARTVLKELGIAQPASEVVLRGYLFQPAGQALPLPHGHNPHSTSGHWTALSGLDRCTAGDGVRYLPLQRLRWLAPALLTAADRPLEAAALTRHLAERFAAGARPVLVAALNEAGEETSRFFVVPDAWPG